MAKKIERALISVWDKAGVVDFARALAERGVEILSTGGTAKALRAAGLTVKDVSEFTGFPEMLDGRVKTLHPKVHAGILHRRADPAHVATMRQHDLQPIDLVCVNLYPFEATIAKPGVTQADAIENIDIGGPTMIRSAAKNCQDVTVVVEPADYARVLADIASRDGDTSPALRLELAQKVFARTAQYDAAIATYLAGQLPAGGGPRPFVRALSGGTALRYGENPHQAAWFYREPAAPEACIAHTEQLHGKEMSYNNYLDGDAALEAVKELSGVPAVAVIKHSNPCGFATGKTLLQALDAAWNGDPVSAFGSVIAVTAPVDAAAAEFLKGRFVEALIAPDFAPDALERLKNKSKNIRLLKLHKPCARPAPRQTFRQIHGGLLVQGADIGLAAKWEEVTQAKFPAAKKALAEFGLAACKHTKSNAIVLVREYAPGCYAVLGMGAGQPNRVDSLRKLAATKARENLKLAGVPEEQMNGVLGDCVLISDAFFPFADSIDEARAIGARYIVQPGGSVRDADVVAACDRHGIAMVFTGMRHFRH